MTLSTRRQHSRNAMIIPLYARPRTNARADLKSLSLFAGIIFAAFTVFFYGFVAWDRTERMSGGAPASMKADVSRETIQSPPQFIICPIGGGGNCIVDGDTFWLAGEKIRIADIDTPETHPPRCAHEAALGNAATQRLQALLNAGPFSLQSIDRDTDRYGRKLRVVVRSGQTIGDTLVREGLARPYAGGYRESWCA